MQHWLASLLILITLSANVVRAQDVPPDRIAVLSWALAELVLELDIAPVGVADMAGYRKWVRQPALPEGVTDLGLRQEPNIERLADLAPDLILASDQQADLVPVLERIAPVWVIQGFDTAQDNAAASRTAYLDLAHLMGRETLAKERLATLDARIAAAGARVWDHFGGAVPPILPIRLLTSESLRLHGANSMALAALEGMGLQHAAPGRPTEWGFVQKRVEELALFDEAIVLQIEPFPEKDALYATQMWQFMPFVRGGRYAEVRPVWTFGGVFSLGYLADAFAEALVSLDPEAAR
ncbi:iron complex transport system substrate-binding protein [Roseovarius azorensis]|uniref:Iron complex transport system substrate-binding protein n=1 Tax=Roseovarius azorensis TaxID=1287727 RepID=A0A1H7LZQ0_9RHOB|nr:iron-siderophore ABC transporter substrate-binding protein [Roseovarius azorensis]SEL04456.1 iron complex transport system substrate-binding protein [Roseovarius azorensis]